MDDDGDDDDDDDDDDDGDHNDEDTDGNNYMIRVQTITYVSSLRSFGLKNGKKEALFIFLCRPIRNGNPMAAVINIHLGRPKYVLG
ncbi:hypothetical protein ElyMa_005438400 [Elysia marginata]|uniref:Uncharacterized protein n=1 Tax=Elysia marginata TaxID=1093978 RepID=A0AAV4EL21_9GAST|nr:hypothetical protein ElyMa_005438400 [Elysia marginata]